MRNDPIVEELQALREARAARFNFNFDLMSEDLRQRQEASRRAGRVFVSFPPRRPADWQASPPNNTQESARVTEKSSP